MGEWQPIETAPKDGTRIVGKEGYVAKWPASSRMRYRIRETWWGKTSHVPLYGWCHGRDAENIDLWEPTRWRPAAQRDMGAAG